MSQQNINLDVLDEQLRTVEVDLGLLNTYSNDWLHQVPSTSSGVMNDFIIISYKPISEELVEEIGMPEPTNEQKAVVDDDSTEKNKEIINEKIAKDHQRNQAEQMLAKNKKFD